MYSKVKKYLRCQINDGEHQPDPDDDNDEDDDNYDDSGGGEH